MQTAAQSPINRRLWRNTVHKHSQSGRASLYLAGAVPCKARQTNLQRDKGALNAALRIFLRVVQQSLVSACPGAAKADPAHLHLGAVAFIHRFGSSLNTHVHFGGRCPFVCGSRNCASLVFMCAWLMGCLRRWRMQSQMHRRQSRQSQYTPVDQISPGPDRRGRYDSDAGPTPDLPNVRRPDAHHKRSSRSVPTSTRFWITLG